jgi:(p)ppGpp synthase/HD superfamily hydrolase
MNRQDIASMPLHTITAECGTAGLLARFAHETSRLNSRGDRIKVTGALALACRLHRGDQRQAEPYINHPLRVALRIISHYELADSDLIAAAFLHDVVEDHADDLSPDGRPEAFAALADVLGHQVADLIKAVTNPVRAPRRERHDQYRQHVAETLAAHPKARILKVSDFTDNAVGLHYTTGDRATRLAHKYAPLVPIFKDHIARSDTPLAATAKTRILAQLDKATTRLNERR